jgi:chaperonin GroEL
MAKKMFYDEDARARVLGGAKQLYDAVKVTMGPKGRNVIISKSYGNPTVTHDGVTVAKAVDLPEKDDETLGYSVGAELVKQAANKMNDVAGDGTTTVTVLTYHILNEANKLIAAGHNPMDLRRELEAAGEAAVKELDKVREDITAKQDKVAEIATISAGDKKIGEMIADVIGQVGKDGVVTVEEGRGLQMESEVVEGFNMDRGFVSPYMVTDQKRMEAVYDKPLILVTDQKISSIQNFLPILEKAAQAGKKDLVIIAEDLEGEALGTLVLNKLKGVFNALAIKAPAFGDRRKAVLEDIATLTGATVISEERGFTFENADLSMLGTARKVISDKDSTTIIEGAGKPGEIKSRIEQIAAQAENATSEYDKENLEKRMAALGGKVAVIKVGGASETEIEEKKFRVDDAVAAAKAALDGGIVPGGGVTLVNIANKLKGKDVGTQLLKNALRQPFLHLMDNAGQNGEVKLAEVLAAKPGQGFDVQNPDKLVDVVESGIIDPARVTLEAIQSSVSISGTGMTMGALVVEIPEEGDDMPAGGGGGMPGGMMGM